MKDYSKGASIAIITIIYLVAFAAGLFVFKGLAHEDWRYAEYRKTTRILI